MQNINKSNIHNALDYLYARAINYELYTEHDELFIHPEDFTQDMRKYFEELGSYYMQSNDCFVFYT